MYIYFIYMYIIRFVGLCVIGIFYHTSALRWWFSHKQPIESANKMISPIQNGFVGTIGPNLRAHEINSLAELFMGDGVIQGVFFHNGRPSFARHIVQTRKMVENPARKSIFDMLCKYILYKVQLYPYNTIGVANTALLAISKPVDENTTAMYALYERDLPYLVHLYHNTSTITTIKYMDAFYPAIQELSGHSKLNSKIIETMDYHIFSKTVDFHQISENMLTLLCTKTIQMHYRSIVHDFISTTSKYMVMDSPLVFNLGRLFWGKIPLVFREKSPSFIHVLDKVTNKVDSYAMERGYYVFHYSSYCETDQAIEIYAPLYENLDFSTVNIAGKYRKMVLDKATKKVRVEYNRELESLNLDFPIKTVDGRVILRNIDNNRINGFVMVDGLRVVKQWFYDDVFFMGEHVVVGNVLMAFCMKNGRNFLCMIDMPTDRTEFFDCSYELTMGFHSMAVVL